MILGVNYNYVILLGDNCCNLNPWAGIYYIFNLEMLKILQILKYLYE